MTRRPGRNEPCWCGSGKKFKKCHLDRELAPALPWGAISNAADSVWDRKECLHPLAAPAVCNGIVSAHTVQRSGVLERIGDSPNHVRTFYRALDRAGELIPRSVGWRKASTFTGFCARHDDETFAAL